MKKIIIAVVLLLLFASPVEARSLANVKIRLSENIQADCRSLHSKSQGCFDSTVQTIYIRRDIDKTLLAYALFHEIGHYLMQDITEKGYNKVFDYGFYMPLQGIQELAAGEFGIWILSYQIPSLRGVVPQSHIEFFISLFAI